MSSTDDPYDGVARGIADAAACMAGFIVLGRYLGLRTASVVFRGDRVADDPDPTA